MVNSWAIGPHVQAPALSFCREREEGNPSPRNDKTSASPCLVSLPFVSSLDPHNAVNETLLVSSGSSPHIPSPNITRGEHEAHLGRVASDSIVDETSMLVSSRLGPPRPPSPIATVTEGASVGHWATHEHQHCRPLMFVSVGTVRAGENTHLEAIEWEHLLDG